MKVQTQGLYKVELSAKEVEGVGRRRAARVKGLKNYPIAIASVIGMVAWAVILQFSNIGETIGMGVLIALALILYFEVVIKESRFDKAGKEFLKKVQGK
jgi:hypothetical protein